MMFVKAVLVASIIGLSQANCGSDPAAVCPFLESSRDNLFVDLMNDHFDKSVEYMLTSKQYGSQYMERPGMAKLLMDASDREWEEGMDVLKKYMQRGGEIQVFNEQININAQPQLADYDNRTGLYATTLDGLLTDAEARFDSFNRLHQKSQQKLHYDFDIGHFLDDKLEEEAETIYKLTSHKKTLAQMSSLGVAVSMFDEAL